MISRPPLRSLSLRPDDSLTIRKMALSIGFQDSVPFLLAIQATGLLTFAPVGLSPTEHASLPWTHQHAGLSRRTPDSPSSAHDQQYAPNRNFNLLHPGFWKVNGQRLSGIWRRRLILSSECRRGRNNAHPMLFSLPARSAAFPRRINCGNR